MVVILFLFLWNFRTTAISIVAIPLSLVVAVFGMKLLGITINTMTLGGMAIAIGALVDDTIIDVENVFRRLKENHHLPDAERRPALRVICDASREIRASIVNATLIIIVVFLPLFFLSGVEGRLLRPLGFAYVVSIGGVAAVVITSRVVSIASLVGFVTLFGIATRNGILLVAHYRQLLGESVSFREAVVRGSLERLSPILMTALTAGLALIPLALGGGEPGNELQTPMAIVILGGLLSSTALNMIVLPALYWLYGEQAVAKEAEADLSGTAVPVPGVATPSYG